MRHLAWMLAAGAIMLPVTAMAQAKVYGTSGMDRGQAGIARLQAQQSISAKTIQAIAQCGNRGQLYGPGFAGSKTGNCPDSLTISPSDGGIVVSGGANIGGGLIARGLDNVFTGSVSVKAHLDVYGHTTLHDDLGVDGPASFGDNAYVRGNTILFGATTANGVVTANSGINVHNGWVRVYGNYGTNFADHGGGWYMTDATWLRSYGNKDIYTGGNIRADGQFQIGTSVFGPPPVCNVATQKLYWNNGWSCQTTIGGAGAGETDPEVGNLASGKWCYSNGTQVICNQPAPTANAFRLPPACNATTAKLRWTGTTWECVTDHYGDDLGSHVATQNINLNGHWLSGDGQDGGFVVAEDGTIVIRSKKRDGAHNLVAVQISPGALYVGDDLHGTDTENQAIATTTLPYQGAYIGWNQDHGWGFTTFMNHPGTGTGGFEFVNFDNSGNYLNTAMLLTREGSMTVAGSVTATAYYQSSDRRLKTDITPIKHPFALLGAIHGKHYYWKKDGTPAYGVIAQDVETVMPEAVHTDGNGIKSVNYTALVPVLLEAIKQLDARVHALEAHR